MVILLAGFLLCPRQEKAAVVVPSASTKLIHTQTAISACIYPEQDLGCQISVHSAGSTFVNIYHSIPSELLWAQKIEGEGMNFEEQLLATKCWAQKTIYSEPFVK